MLGLKTVVWEKSDFETILTALSEGLYDVNNDFNGTNGEDFTSDAALDAGFISDMEYIKDQMRKANETVSMDAIAMTAFYLANLFADEDWYAKYEFEMIKHPTLGIIGVSVAWYDV